jgi:hypothetical protein
LDRHLTPQGTIGYPLFDSHLKCPETPDFAPSQPPLPMGHIAPRYGTITPQPRTLNGPISPGGSPVVSSSAVARAVTHRGRQYLRPAVRIALITLALVRPAVTRNPARHHPPSTNSPQTRMPPVNPAIQPAPSISTPRPSASILPGPTAGGTLASSATVLTITRRPPTPLPTTSILSLTPRPLRPSAVFASSS